jgi:CHAT domain-containing protein
MVGCKFCVSGRGTRFARLYCAFAALSTALFHGRECLPAEIPKYVGKPIDVIDRFDTDTRSNYKFSGGAEWSMLKVSLPANSEVGLTKTLAADFTLDFDIWPKPVGDKELSTSRASFIISGGHHLVIVINRTKQNNVLMRQAQLLEVHDDGNDPPQQVADDIGRSPAFSMTGDVEQWTVRYKNGLVKVSCNSQPLVTTYTNGFISWCQAIGISQLAGAAELSRVELHGREAGYTREQREIYDRTNQMHAAAEKAKDARDFTTAILTERQRIPQLEQAFAPDESPAALAHEWIGNTAGLMQRWDGAKKEHGLAVEAFTRSLGENHPYVWFSRLLVARDMAELGELEAAEALARPNADAFLRLSSRDPRAKLCEQCLRRVLHLQARRKLEQADYQTYLRYRKEMAESCLAIQGPKDGETKRTRYELANAQRIIDAPPNSQSQIAALIRVDLQVIDLGVKGEITAAEELMNQHLPQCRKYLADAPLTANWLRYLSVEEINRGNFGVGLQYVEEAASIYKKIGGENDSEFAASEADLASAYSQLGRYAEAAPRFEHAFKTLVANGDTHWDRFASLLLEYGRHHIRLGQWKDAEEKITKSLQVYREIGEESHPNALKARERLADVYKAKGDLAKADKMLAEQRQLAAGMRGNAKSIQAEILMQEANMLWWKGKLDESEQKYKEAIACLVSVYGKRGRGYEAAMENLMELYAYRKDYKSASKALGELLEYARLRRESLFAVYTPSQQFEQSSSDRPWLNRLMAMVSNHLIDDQDAYEHLLEIKGAVTLHQRRTQLAASRPELAELVKRQQENGSLLAAMYARSVPEAEMSKLAQLLAERTSIEQEMMRRSAAYRTAAKKVTVARLRELLPPNVAVVDYIEYEVPPNFLERLFTSDPQSHLAAFVVSKQQSPKFIELGPSARIEKAMLEWARAIVKESRNVFAGFDPKLEQDTDRTGATVRELIWDPLRDYLRAADTIVISPDGTLIGCPFPALPLNDKPEYLIEQKALAQVAAVSLIPDLLTRKTQTVKPNFLFVGDVDYDRAKGGKEPGAAAPPTQNRVPFQKLPPSRKHVGQLYKRAFPQGSLRELAASETTESNVRQASAAASIIYLDTHGFCVRLSILRSIANQAEVRLPFDPYIAGIALAGANHWMSGTDASDGILWASEIAMLNLEAADIVTLNACETALGNAIPGEGMQGCQRALTIAGARSSLTSIWMVFNPADDLIEHFFDSLWTDRTSKSEALRKAMRYMLREFDWSKNRKLSAAHRCPPFVWSSWILSGDWR